MKKIISSVLAVLMCVSSASGITCNAIDINGTEMISTEGYGVNENGNFWIASNSIVKVIDKAKTYYSFGKMVGYGVLEVDKEPESGDEAEEMWKQLSAQNKKACMVKGDNPYVFRFVYNDDGTLATEKIDCDANPVCTIDLVNLEIRDYDTDEVLQKMEAGNIAYWTGPYALNGPDYGVLYIPVTYMGEFFMNGEAFGSFIVPSSDNGCEITKGDIDMNGTVDLSDLTELSLVLLKDKELINAQQIAADINKDGKVDVSDIARLKQYVSKMISSLR